MANHYNQNFDKDEYVKVQKERVNNAVNSILKTLETGEFTDIVSKIYLKTYPIPSDTWSLRNRIIQYNCGTIDGRTFLAWKDAERYVKKGAKAFYILEPVMARFFEFDEKENKEVQKFRLIGFKPTPRFRVEDTEGAEIKYVDEPKKLLPLKEVAEKFGITVKYDRTIDGEFGSFSASKNEIRLCTDNVYTFFHELIHCAHSKIEKLKNGQDSEQEIIAQLGATILAKVYGYETKEDLNYTFKYLNSYADSEQDRKKLVTSCMKVIGKLEKILNLILKTDLETKLIEQDQEPIAIELSSN